MPTDLPAFSDVHLFWEIDERGHLTIAIRAPVAYLRVFSDPSDVLYRFLDALQARGVGMAHTVEARTRIDTKAGTFLVRWTGEVHQNPELVQAVMPELTAQLGVRSFGG